MTDSNGATIFKLGKKYGKLSSLSEPITTLYLTEEEHESFSGLPGYSAKKTRYEISGGSLDLYQGPNSGFMLFELEFENELIAKEYVPPEFVLDEITNDGNYSGFSLASKSVTP